MGLSRSAGQMVSRSGGNNGASLVRMPSMGGAMAVAGQLREFDLGSLALLAERINRKLG